MLLRITGFKNDGILKGVLKFSYLVKPSFRDKKQVKTVHQSEESSLCKSGPAFDYKHANPDMFWSTGPSRHHALSTWALKERGLRRSSKMRAREGSRWGCPTPGHSSRPSLLGATRVHRGTQPEIWRWGYAWSWPGTAKCPGWTGDPGSPTSSAGCLLHRRMTGRGSDPAPPGTPGRPHGRKQSRQSPAALCREREGETIAWVNNTDENSIPCSQLMWQENRSRAGSILMDAVLG